MTPDAQHLLSVASKSTFPPQAMAWLAAAGLAVAVVLLVCLLVMLRRVGATKGELWAYVGAWVVATPVGLILSYGILSSPGIGTKADVVSLHADVMNAYDLEPADARHLVRKVAYGKTLTGEGDVTAGTFALRDGDGHLWPAGQWFIIGEGDQTFWLATTDADDRLVVLGTDD